MSRQKKKGFTLVELVVVLVIMTVILGIAIPSVLHYMKMAEFRKNEENAKTVYLAAESKLTYYRSSGQWEEFKKEVMSQGKEAPFTDSKRKGKIYGITLDKEHDGASASNNAVLGLLDGYTYDKSMLDASIAKYKYSASGKSSRKSERTADHLCKHPGSSLLSAGKSVNK
ncbi:MAG: prepilin-type N-terminal cleavage/methylation domain-containing protein [Lachnospiraceae bacterium]